MLGGLQVTQIIGKRHPAAVEKVCGNAFRRSRVITGPPIKRPSHPRDLAANQRVRRIVGGANGNIGIALGKVQHLIAQNDIQPDIWIERLELGKQWREKVHQQRVIGGHAQFAMGCWLASSQFEREGRHIIFHARTKGGHFLARRRCRIAIAMALKQRCFHRCFDLAKPAEHRGMIDAQNFRRTNKPASIRDGFHQPDVIPCEFNFPVGHGQSGFSPASIIARLGSRKGGKASRSPNVSLGSSASKPGPSVAISNRIPLGSRKYRLLK